MGALGALGGMDSNALASNPLVLGGAGVVFLLILYVLVNKLRAPGRDTGSYGSSTTASSKGDLRLKNYRSQSAPYNRKVEDSWGVSDFSESRGRSKDRRSRSKNKKRASSSESESSGSSRSRSPSSGGSSSS